MELLGEVEENLRAISVEARKSKQLSGVKEAAERGTLKLRNLKESYAGFLRLKRKAEEEGASSSNPNSSDGISTTTVLPASSTTSNVSKDNESDTSNSSFSFQSHDLIQPFLLACNYMDVGPRLTLLSLSGINHLINRDAMHPDDGPNVMRVLSIQANSPSTEVQLRVLQSSLLLVSSKSCTITEELLSKALLVCFSLSQSKDATVRNAATATVRQVLSMLFDRVVREQSMAQRNHAESIAKAKASGDDAATASLKQSEPLTMGLEGVGRCAYLVFQDLCVLSRGEQGVWLKRTCVAPSMGLELVESVLSQQPLLFSTDPMFSTLVSRQVCPLLLQILHEKIEFPLFVRVMRAFTTLLRDFGHILIKQCEPLLGALLHCLVSSSAPNLELSHSGFEDGVGASPAEKVWSSLLVLESLQAVCSDSKLLFTLYRVYDCAEDIEEVLKEEEEIVAAAAASAASTLVVNSASCSPTAALALLKNDEAKILKNDENDSQKKETSKRPMPLVSNLVNVISHFLTEGTSSEHGMAFLFRGLKSLAAANHGHPIRPRNAKTGNQAHVPNAIATGIASTLSSFTSQHHGSGLLSNMNSQSTNTSETSSNNTQNTPSKQSQPQPLRSNTNSTTATTLFAGSYSFRELSLETHAPYPVPEGESLAIALNCLVAISDSLKSATIDAFGQELDFNNSQHSFMADGADSAAPSAASGGTSFATCRIIKPPPSSITKNKSTLSLAEFLNIKDEQNPGSIPSEKTQSSEVVTKDESRVRKVEAYDKEEANIDDLEKGLSERQKELMHAQRACVRAFVSSVWEHFLSVISELLLQVNSTAALAAATASSSNQLNQSSGNSNMSGGGGGVSHGAGSGNGNNASQSHNQTSINSTGSMNQGDTNKTNGNNKPGPVSTHRILLDKLLSVSVSLTVAAGACGLSAPRDCLLGTLCKASTPTPMINAVYNSSIGDGNIMLHNHNTIVLKAVLIVSHTLANSLGPAWSVVVSALDKVDIVLRKSVKGRTTTSKTEEKIKKALIRFVEFTTVLELNALSSIVESLMNLNRSNLNLNSSPASQNIALSPNSNSSNLSNLPQSPNQNTGGNDETAPPPSQMSINPMSDYDSQLNGGGSGGGGFGRAFGSLLTGVSDRLGVGKGLAASANAYYAPVTPSAGSNGGNSSMSNGGGATTSASSSQNKVVVDASTSFSSLDYDKTSNTKSPAASNATLTSNKQSPASTSSLPTNSNRAVVPTSDSVPFALRALVAIASANQHRLLSLWPDIVDHLELVANVVRSPELRCFAIDAFRSITKDAILGIPPAVKLANQESGEDRTNKTNVNAGPSVNLPPITTSNEKEPLRLTSLGMLIKGSNDDVNFEELFLIDRTSLNKYNVPTSSSSSAESTVKEDRYAQSRLKTALLLKPLLNIAQKSDHLEVKEQVLLVLHGLVVSCGSKMTPSLWPSFFNILAVSCGRGETDLEVSSTKDDTLLSLSTTTTTPNKSNATNGTGNKTASSSPSVPVKFARAWGGQCVPIGFRCLKLITDDFLECVPKDFLPKVVECAAAFAAQEIDMNVSLTAIEILWYVADYVQKQAKQESTNSITTSSSKPTPSSSSQISLEVWYIMMKEFYRVSIDSRPEVRNCGVNTLVTSVVAYGNSLSLDQWEFIFTSILIPLVETADTSMNNAAKDGDAGVRHEVRPGVQLTMHHSRDTASKQWSETKVLAIQGLARLLRCALASPKSNDFVVLDKKDGFLSQAVSVSGSNSSPRITLKAKKAEAAAAAAAASSSSSKSLSIKEKEKTSSSSTSESPNQSWFSDAWYSMLHLGLKSIKSGDGGGSSSSAEVAVAGVFLLILMNKISSSSGVSNDPVRYATGMRVVNGALVQMDKTKLKNEAAAAATAAANAGTAGSTSIANKKWFSKQAWLSSWRCLLKACDGYSIDEDGDIGAAITEGFSQIYKSSESAEFSESELVIELLHGLASLIPPRYPPLLPGQRPPFRLPITKAQKNSLALIRTLALKLSNKKTRSEGDERCWYALVSLLSKFSIPSTPKSADGSLQLQNTLSVKFCASTSELLLELFSLDPSPPPSSSSSTTHGSAPPAPTASLFPLTADNSKVENKEKKDEDRIKLSTFLLSHIPAYLNERKDDNTIATRVRSGSNGGGGTGQSSTSVGKADSEEKQAVKIPHWAIASSFQGLLAGLFPINKQQDDKVSPHNNDGNNVTVSSLNSNTLPCFIVDGKHATALDSLQGTANFSLLPPVLRSPQSANRWLIELTKDTTGGVGYELSEANIPLPALISTINTLISVAAPGLRAIAQEELTSSPSNNATSTKSPKTERKSQNSLSSNSHEKSDKLGENESLSFAEFSCAEDDDIPPPPFPWELETVSANESDKAEEEGGDGREETSLSSKSDSSSHSTGITARLPPTSSVGQGWFQLISSCEKLLLPWCIKKLGDTASAASSNSPAVESSVDMRAVLMSLVVDDKLAVFPNNTHISQLPSSAKLAKVHLYQVPLFVSLKAIDMLANVLFGLTTATILKASSHNAVAGGGGGDDVSCEALWTTRHKKQRNTEKSSSDSGVKKKDNSFFKDERWSLGEVPLIVFIVEYFAKTVKGDTNQMKCDRCLTHLHSWSHFILLLCGAAHRLKPQPLKYETNVSSEVSAGGITSDEEYDDGYSTGFKSVKLQVAGAVEALSLLSLHTLSKLLQETTYTNLSPSSGNVTQEEGSSIATRTANVWKSKKNKIQNVVLSLAPILCENVSGVGATSILRRQSASLLRESKISETIANLRHDIEQSQQQALDAEARLRVYMKQNGEKEREDDRQAAEAYATGFPF